MPVIPPSPAENLLKKVVAAQFSTRPSLRSVVAQMLTSTLEEKYPPLLSIPLSGLRLALPREGGGRGLRPLLDVALQHLADGSFPDLSFRYGLDAYLSDKTGTRLTFQANGERSYDRHVFEDAIRELPLILFVGAQEALATYWEQNSDAGGSRWQWLASVLRGRLSTSAVRQSGDDAQQLQILSTLADCPSREARSERLWPDNAIHAYTLETQLVRGNTTLTLQASDILVVSGSRVFWCALSGQILSYASLDAFGEAWGKHMQAQWIADTITWRQYEPDGDIFEVQAALILNQQLDALARIRLPADSTVHRLETQFDALTDPAELFSHAPRMPGQTLLPIQAALPDWLRDASPADRFAFHQRLLEQANLRRLTHGKGYLDGLDDIRTYATRHLNHQLCLDRAVALGGQRTCNDAARAAGYRADELTLTFHVAVGSLAGGYLAPVSMSLVDLALKNLSGSPRGRMTLSHRSGRALEAWLTPAYVLQLVQRVDIGNNYPAYLRRELMGDTAAARKRQRLFNQQRPLHLKTQALEHALRGEAGLTTRGARCVRALLATNPLARRVDGDEIVIRPLAFLRTPAATADVAQNMFIIEPLDTRLGPHRCTVRPIATRCSSSAAANTCWRPLCNPVRYRTAC